MRVTRLATLVAVLFPLTAQALAPNAVIMERLRARGDAVELRHGGVSGRVRVRSDPDAVRAFVAAGQDPEERRHQTRRLAEAFVRETRETIDTPAEARWKQTGIHHSPRDQGLRITDQGHYDRVIGDAVVESSFLSIHFNKDGDVVDLAVSATEITPAMIAAALDKGQITQRDILKILDDLNRPFLEDPRQTGCWRDIQMGSKWGHAALQRGESPFRKILRTKAPHLVVRTNLGGLDRPILIDGISGRILSQKNEKCTDCCLSEEFEESP